MLNLELFRDADDTRAFGPGETIFLEGDEGRLMYVVLEGSVKLSVTGRAVETVGRGGAFGEMALIDSAPRSATAIAAAACRLAPISKERFNALVKADPAFALEIMAIMAARLRRMDRRI